MARNDYANNNIIGTTSTDAFESIPAGYTVSPTTPADGNWPQFMRTIPADEGAATFGETEPMYEPSRDEGETQIVDSFKNGEDGESIRPVVGWLVGIKGACCGMDYRLHSQRNFIGRGMKFDVNLPDMKVSRGEPTVQVVYDPLSNCFLVASGSSSAISYLNGSAILAVSELKPYDKLRIGDSELLFVPFCGDKFVWEEKA